MALKQVTDASFVDDVLNQKGVVVVDFWAPWCGPCRALGPVVQEVAGELKGKLEVYKCNVDEEEELATRFRIVSIPTLIVFKDGKPVHTMVGNMPKADLLGELKAWV